MARRPIPPVSRARIVIIGLVILFLISVSTLVRFYTDILWFREVGFDSVYFGILGSQLGLAVVFGLAFFLFSLVNFIVVGRIMPMYRIATDPEDSLERYRGALIPYLRVAAIGGSLFLAVIFALGVTPLWQGFVLFRNAVPFGETDPQFGRDLSFYIFKLPVYQYLYSWGFSAVALVTVLVAGAHYMTGGIRAQAIGDRVTPQVKVHLSVLIGLVALIRAWGYRLNQFELLYSERGEVTGASYTDVHAELPALQLLVIISIIAAVLFLVNIRFRGWMLPVIGVGLWLLVSILAAGVYPFIVQRFQVQPSELQRERPFIERNIAATRAAYGIDKMEVREFPAQPGIDVEELRSNEQTIDAIRLWDPDTLKTVYKQLQAIRPYYEFTDVDVDRYVVDGKTRQVMLSAREIDLTALGTQTWLNEHLVFTHGHGTVVSPTNEIQNEGQPTFFVQGIPAQSIHPALELTEGGIYFGEAIASDAYSIVNTEQRELDYALEDEAETTRYTNYAGDAGVRISGLLRKAAFAWRFRDMNILISNLITSDSKALFYRQIRDRVERAAPFLKYDGDPYVVAAGGRIYWMIDAFTVSDMYPYSEQIDFGERTLVRGVGGGRPSTTGRYNYIRNSVKVTIDAYDGTMSFHVWDPEDPIIRAWRNAFPALFRDGESMQAELKNHIRYPEDLFRVQTQVYLRYHMTEPQEFYTREDLWVIPKDPMEGIQPLGDELQPYFVLMRLPGSAEMEYVLILPMNPRGRQNMVSFLAAKAGPEDYGRLIDLRFPRGQLVFGVQQVSARINADDLFSRTRTLFEGAGSNVIIGNLLVIPVGNSILYAMPMFLQATAESIPELKFVILATSDRIVMQPTLQDAITALVEGRPSEVVLPPEIGGTESELIQQALQHLIRAEEALRNGDLATYESENEAARRVLERSPAASPSPSPSPAS